MLWSRHESFLLDTRSDLVLACFPVAKSRWYEPNTKSISKDIEPFLSFTTDDKGVVEFQFGFNNYDADDPGEEERVRKLIKQLEDSPSKLRVGMFAWMFPYTAQGIKQ